MNVHRLPFSESLGAYLAALVCEPDWVARRIETCQILDMERTVRRVSLDIDTKRLRTLARYAGIAEKRIPIPL
ncbi:MAG: hypothetical protein LBK59_11555, partial [Bifidobacteriaceae bacterium]|nr:hypothetical protein [Bifidobacteriaceae bacterium]